MKYLSLLLLVPALTAGYQSVSTTNFCQNSCEGLENGAWIEDVHDCRSFLICPDNETSYYCGENLVPNTIVNQCVISNYECDPKCGGHCKLECSVSVDHVIDYKNSLTNCSSYYICILDEEPSLKHCPESSPYFDSKLEQCSTDKSVCCHGCSPQCEENSNGNVEDPRDCDRYYICRGGKIAGHASCRSGFVFNATIGDCAEGDSCVNSCNVNKGTFTTTLSPSHVTDDAGCMIEHVCTEAGSFRKCPFCHSEYFECSSADGNIAEIKNCEDDRVFNPSDSYAFCIFNEECPFN